jgi:hypothetical protein
VGELFTYLTSQLCKKCQIPSSECLKFYTTWNGLHLAHSRTYQMFHYSFVYSSFGQVSKIYPVQKLVFLTVCTVSSSFTSDSHKCPASLCSDAHISQLNNLVRNMVFHINVRTYIYGVWEECPEELRERKSQNTGEKNLRDEDLHTFYCSV